MRHKDELRRLLRGDPIPAEDEPLAQVLRELRARLSSPPPETVAQEHLTAIAAAANRAAHEAPTVAPAGRLHRWGRRIAAAGALKIATVATVAAAATGGGLAATGNLPQAVQDGMARAAQSVGIDLPDSGDRLAPADPPEERPVEDPATTDDEAVPFEKIPTGDPSETPSDAGVEHHDDNPTHDEPPADRSEESDERSGPADGHREDEAASDDGTDRPGSLY